MSGAAPDPAPPSTRSFGLLVLVRALIDYGRELTATLRQHGTAALDFSVRHFGTDDVALILARITHGLHLAAALETAHHRHRAPSGRRPQAAPHPNTLHTARPANRRTARQHRLPARRPCPRA